MYYPFYLFCFYGAVKLFCLCQTAEGLCPCIPDYRNPSAYEESSCLRLLLDKRDAWLGPWIPGRFSYFTFQFNYYVSSFVPDIYFMFFIIIFQLAISKRNLSN